MLYPGFRVWGSGFRVSGELGYIYIYTYMCVCVFVCVTLIDF